MKQRRRLPILWINSVRAIRLVKITTRAGKSQILHRGHVPAYPGQNVLNMECRSLK